MIPSAQNIAMIYALEKAAELGFKTYLESAGVKTFAGSLLIPSSGDADLDKANVAAGYNIIDFQKDRPRVEIFATLGAGKQQFIPHPQYPDVECETLWDITIAFNALTRADMMVHDAYRTMVRYLTHSARGVINGVGGMENHYLGTITDGGTSPVEVPEQGIFRTILSINSMISVQANAWALLTTE